MTKKIFLFLLISVLFLSVSITVLAQDIYNNALNKAREVGKEVENKVQEETEIIITPTVTPESTPLIAPNPAQAKEQTRTRETLKNRGEEYKSMVANAVQNLVRSAERWEEENPGIGSRVRIIAQEQNSAMERIVSLFEKMDKRNSVLKFLIGSDYKQIKEAKRELEQNRLRIQQLNQIANQLQNEEDKAMLQEQIQLLEEENTSLEEMLNQEGRRFSLFGWLIKLFQ